MRQGGQHEIKTDNSCASGYDYISCPMDDWTFTASFYSGVPMNIVKYILAVLVVLAIAEAIPEVVNAVLILLLIGIVLMRFQYFTQLFNLIGSIGK